MSSKEQGDRKFTIDCLRSVMDEVAHLQVATTFHITDGISERIFYFVRGGVRLLSAGPHAGPGLPGYLLQTERIEVDALHEALEESRSRKKDLRQVLIDKNILSKEECNEIVAHLIRDELYELVFWNDAIYMVHTQEPPEELFKLDRPFLHGSIDNEELTRDVLRWLDDWARIRELLPSDQIKIRTTEAGRKAAPTLQPGVAHVLNACEDELPLRQLRISGRLPLNDLCTKLLELEREEMVTLEPDVAHQVRSPEEEIEALEDSLRHLIAKDLVRERLASIYQKMKRPSKAVEHLELIADSALSAKDLHKAVERYKLILQLQPQNVGAFEKLLEFSREYQEASQVKNFALGHLQRLVNLSLSQEAGRCAQILESFPTVRHEVREFRASRLASSGQTKEAALEYAQIAELYEASGDLERAIDCLQKALAHDGSNADAQSQLDRCRRKLKERTAEKKVTVEKAEKTVQIEAPGTPRPAAVAGGSRLALAAVILVPVVAGVYFVFGPKPGSTPDVDSNMAHAESPGVDHPPPPLSSGGSRNDRRPAERPVVRLPSGPRGTGAGRSDPRPPPEHAGGAASPRSGPEEPRRPGTSDPCAPENLRTRPLSDTHVALYAHGCPLFVRDQTQDGKLAHEFPAGEGSRWAFSRSGRFICRWQPGERPTVFTLPQGLEFPLSWRIPEFTGALAIDKDRIIIRENHFTAIFRFDGTPVTSANLPLWDEATIVGNRLVLCRSEAETRALWVVETDTLDFLWSCRNEPDGLIVR